MSLKLLCWDFISPQSYQNSFRTEMVLDQAENLSDASSVAYQGGRKGSQSLGKALPTWANWRERGRIKTRIEFFFPILSPIGFKIPTSKVVVY
jgi:hypothetical protein